MKLTKTQLREIIRKELKMIVLEQKSNIELVGPDVDELLNAIKFINTGLKTSKGMSNHSFGKNTLKVIDKNGRQNGRGNYSIRVQSTVGNVKKYVTEVNELLDDHGFNCHLITTK